MPLFWIVHRVNGEAASLHQGSEDAGAVADDEGSEGVAEAALSGFMGVSEHPYKAMELPNLDVIVLDILARVLTRGHVVRRFEIMAIHDIASRAHHECSIVRHNGRPAIPLNCKIERPFADCVNRTPVIRGAVYTGIKKRKPRQPGRPAGLPHLRGGQALLKSNGLTSSFEIVPPIWPVGA